MIVAILGLGILVLLLAFMAARLRAGGFAPAVCTTLLFILTLQLLTALTTTVLSALVFALMMAFIGASAAALVRAQTARQVVTLGFSLAAAQAVSPMGMMVTAILAPALAFMKSSGETPVRNVGLLVLLLFVPVAAALMLAYLAHEFGFDPATLTTGSFDHILPARIFQHVSPSADGAIKVLVLALIAFPIWILAARHVRARPIATVASALIVAVAATTLLHRPLFLGAFVPSLASLSCLALSEAGSEAVLPGYAILLSSLSAIATWLFIAAPV